MTERERIEKELLLDIIMESSKWRLSEGDDRDCIRIECEQRLAKYMGITPEVADGREQSVVERGLAKLEAKNKSRDTHVGKIRIYEHGKTRWVARELCEQVPCIHSKTGMKWIIRKEVQDEPQN